MLQQTKETGSLVSWKNISFELLLMLKSYNMLSLRKKEVSEIHNVRWSPRNFNPSLNPYPSATNTHIYPQT